MPPVIHVGRHGAGGCKVGPHFLQMLPDSTLRILPRQLHRQLKVQFARVQPAYHLPVPLLPVPYQVRVQVAGPSHAAFKEHEVQAREPLRYPAQEQCLAKRLVCIGEGAQVAENVVCHAEGAPAGIAAVGRGHYLQFLAPLPEGIVVVITVQPDHVHLAHVSPGARVLVFVLSYRPLHTTRQHYRLQPEFVDRVLHLLDGCLRRIHGHDGRGRHPVRIRPINVRRIRIDRPDNNEPLLRWLY